MNETCRKRSLPLRANNSNHFDVSHDIHHPTKNCLFLEKKGRGRLQLFFFFFTVIVWSTGSYGIEIYLLREEVSVIKYAFFAFWGEFFDDN